LFLRGRLLAVVLGDIAYSPTPALGLTLAGGAVCALCYYRDPTALSPRHGRVVTPEEEPHLHGIVDRLCAVADMPKPTVAIADTDVPNAFATGRTPSRAVVCATTGLMRRLDERELEGVLAHELSHVAHRDVTVMTIASVVGVLAGFLTRIVMFSGMGRGRRDSNGAPAVLVVLLVSAVVYALSFVLIRTLSRYRELSADRAAAFLTSRPSALASALVKISGEMGRIPSRDLREAEPYNAFFFAPAVAPGFTLSSLFATHPPLQRRLDQLGEISAELGRPVT
jgi:heat shock protein HtpX